MKKIKIACIERLNDMCEIMLEERDALCKLARAACEVADNCNHGNHCGVFVENNIHDCDCGFVDMEDALSQFDFGGGTRDE